MDDKKMQELLAGFSREWQSIANKAMKKINSELAKGTNLSDAVKNTRKKYPELFQMPQVNELVVDSAIQGYGIKAGLLVVEGRATILEQMSKPWDASGFTLSEKLHSADKQIFNAIVNTLETQIRANKSVIEIARALYDGYGYGNTIIKQDLPKYLNAFRHAMPDDADTLRLARQTAERINALGRNGTPSQALASAYKKLLDVATTGTEKALKNAVYVAVNEKSRYVAERIARTEAAKAWADGFFAKSLQDKHVVGFKWYLSSRHPVYDICDLYLKADMYGLGAGIYPKNKIPPLPAHPHCMCRVAEVYSGEVDLSNQQDNTDNAVNDWLRQLPEDKRKLVLGVHGNREWQDGNGWKENLRGWQGLIEPTTRLSGIKARGL